MKNKYYYLLLFIVCLASSSCRNNKGHTVNAIFVEADDPKRDTTNWINPLSSGLCASFVSIDTKYAKSVMPTLNEETSVHKMEGWKGERLSAQLLLWSDCDVEQVEVKVGNFESEEYTLPKKIAQARFVRYVLTDEFGEGCDECERNPDELDASLAPDMLDSLACFDIERKTVRPVWITIEIPRDARSGNYKSVVEIFAGNKQSHKFSIELEVIEQVLPPASQWTIHLDQWQHPSAVARIHNLELWTDAHFNKMKPLMQMLADMGQKVITTNINKDPWNHQCYDAYEDMIKWTKCLDGSWSYDYTVFDKWVQFMMDLGVTHMINCYSMLPWNNELHYMDEEVGKIVTVSANPGTELFDQMWKPFLTDFVRHQTEKGWLEITNIAMDERNPKDMDITLKTLKKYAPELGVAIADNHKSYKKYPFIRDMCVGAEHPVDMTDIMKRREKGLITTPYICCAHKFPNVFTFSDAAEGTYLSWFALASGYDGWLRWAFNSWVENPLKDSRFRTWPAGDTYIVYPDARSSIRYERVLEGVQDFEKIKILRKILSDKNKHRELDLLNKTVVKFNSLERTSTWNDELNHAKLILNKLSKDN